MKDIKDASKDILGYLAACLADGSVQVWAVPNEKERKHCNRVESREYVYFQRRIGDEKSNAGGLSLSWSQGAWSITVGTVDGSVCVFDIHRHAIRY